MMDMFGAASKDVCEGCQLAVSDFTDAMLHNNDSTFLRSPPFRVEYSNPQNCGLCKLLISSIEKKMLDHNDFMNVRLRVEQTGKFYKSNVVFIENADERTLFSADRGKLRCFTDGDISGKPKTSSSSNSSEGAGWPSTNSVSQLPLARKVGKAGSQQTMATIQRWARDCDLKHLDCHLGLRRDSVAIQTKLPTRVLDVGIGTKDPFLFVSEGKRGKYLALSHRWGQARNITTTRSNYRAHQGCIRAEELPQTFQDAIRVTRELGLRYLWIDSLCIIQDDAKDWNQEAALMGSIYENAYCTIAAAEAYSDDEGCFYQDPRYGDPVCVRSPERNYKVYFALAPLDRHRYFDQGPLFSRAWVLQERLLSRRMLHFAIDQVYWECREGLWAEDHSVTRPTLLSELRKRLFECAKSLHGSGMRTTVIGELILSNPELRLVNIWAEMVKYYTSCALTKREDRLPALLGIANRISAVTELKHIYGWFFDGSSLSLRALLWRRQNDFLVQRKAPLEDLSTGALKETNRSLHSQDRYLSERIPAPYRAMQAPSWSWVSLDGAVNYHYATDEEADDFQVCDSNLDSKTVFGSVRPIARLLKLPNIKDCDNSSYQELTISSYLIKAFSWRWSLNLPKRKNSPDILLARSNSLYDENSLDNRHDNHHCSMIKELPNRQWPTVSTYDFGLYAENSYKVADNSRVCFDTKNCQPETFWLLPLFGRHSMSTKGCAVCTKNLRKYHRLCLVLEPTNVGEHEQKYRRIGFAQLVQHYKTPKRFDDKIEAAAEEKQVVVLI